MFHVTGIHLRWLRNPEPGTLCKLLRTDLKVTAFVDMQFRRRRVRHDFGLRGRYCCQMLGGTRVFEIHDKLSDTLSGIEFEVVLLFVSEKR